jgi:hypothetical protein
LTCCVVVERANKVAIGMYSVVDPPKRRCSNFTLPKFDLRNNLGRSKDTACGPLFKVIRKKHFSFVVVRKAPERRFFRPIEPSQLYPLLLVLVLP